MNNSISPTVTPNTPMTFLGVSSSLKISPDMIVSKDIDAALAAFTKPTFGARLNPNCI